MTNLSGMRVVHINLQPGWRGGEQQLVYLILALKEMEGVQKLICAKDSALEKFAIKNNIEYLSIKKSFFSKLSSLKKLKNLIKEQRIEIVHCHESKGHSLAIYSKILFGFDAKIIVHRRVVFPIKGFLSKKIKYSGKYVDKVICISNAVRSVFENSTKNNNTVIIPDMVDLNFNYTNQQILYKKYNISQKTIIGYIAALTFEKDHFSFLDTAKKLLEKKDNLHFVLIGDGNLKKQIEAYSLFLNIEKQVTFTGFIENAKRLIPEIDILLFTSTQEGLGSTILDFFAARKPVITVKNGGTEDLVFNGKTGFICEQKDINCLADKVIHLLDNPFEKDKIVSNALNFANANFSIPAIAQKTLLIYYQVYK